MRISPKAALPTAIVVMVVVMLLITAIGRDPLFLGIGLVLGVIAGVATYLGVDHRTRAQVQSDDYFAQARGLHSRIIQRLGQVLSEAAEAERYMRRDSYLLLMQGLEDVRNLLEQLMSHQQEIGDLQMQLEKWFEQVDSLSTLIHFFVLAAPDPGAYPGADEALKQVDPAIAQFAGTARDAVRLANQGQMLALKRSAALLTPMSIKIPDMTPRREVSSE